MKLGNYYILRTDQKKLTKNSCKSLINIVWLMFKNTSWFTTYKKMETIFMNTENSGTNELHRFKLDLADKLNLKNPGKKIALANLSIYYTWKSINSE